MHKLNIEKDIFAEKNIFGDEINHSFDVIEKYVSEEINLSPNEVRKADGKILPALTNLGMGYVFEELIRKFNEENNEEAGEHFTPREVIKLIVDLLLINDADAITGSGIIRTVYDPACGTGGMLALMEEAMKEFNSKIHVELY